MLTTAVCVALLALTVTGAQAKVEHLGKPCRAKNVLAGRIVKDRSSGRDLLVLTNTNETSGVELIFIDYRKNTGRVIHCPAGSGAWALNEVPGDRMVVGTYYDGKFMVFDLKKTEFIKTVDFPGESYIWNLAMGSDGRIYGGTYGGGKLGALDLNTYAVEDCGAPAPPNMYLRNVSSIPDGRILCSFGMDKPATLLYDPETKRFDPAPKQLQGVGIGVTWNGFFLAGSLVCKGKSLDVVDPPPFPVPPADKGSWSVDTRMTTDKILYLRQGRALYRYAPGDKELTLAADIDLRGGGMMAADNDGNILGVRGQDYFVVKPGDNTVHLKPMPVESSPRPVMFLRADEQGTLWGGPHFGQTLFSLDPKTRKAVNTGTICNAGGEVYDVTFCDGKVYAVSYAAGDIVCYDPTEPWDQWNGKNPKTIAKMGEKGYIRPIAGVVLGPDHKLYSGWMAKYGVYGGAVAITDPDTGATEVIENPLGEQAISGVAVDASHIYIGSSLGANGLPNKRGEWAKFGILDLATKNVEFSHTFDGVYSVRVFGFDPKAKVVAVAVGDTLELFDPAKKEFRLLPDAPKVAGRSIGFPGDGSIYYGNGNSVFKVDLLSGKAETLAELPETVSNVAVGPKGVVYASCGVDVYAVKR